MIVKNCALLLGVCLGVTSCTQDTGPSGDTSHPTLDTSQPTTLVLTNGLVRTPAGWEEALAVSGAEILAVGDTETIDALIGSGTEIVDLDGSIVLPGFHDMHVHPLFAGVMHSGANRSNCVIEQGSSAAVLVSTLEACIGRLSDDEWVTGGQWDASALGTTPGKALIDPVSIRNPVFLNDTSGHSAWVNTRALELAAIDANTPDPEGGIIERDASGEPTGVLRETAVALVRTHVPPISDETLRLSLTWAVDEMLSHGITSYTEAFNGYVAGPNREAELYARLAEDGTLKQRIRLCINWLPEAPGAEDVIANRTEYESERVTVDCVKLFLDGVPTDSHTAAMLEPYAATVEGRDDDASRFGLLLLEQAVTDEAVTRFDKEGLRVKFHAAGDAAVRSGLDAIAAAREANGMTGPRHDVGHCTFIATDDLPRAAELNATFEVSPYLWSPSPINDDIAAAVGIGRIERAWPVRDILETGTLPVAGSDCPIVPSVNPWLAVESLVTRREPGGSSESFGAGQAISVEQAIDLFTINPARHSGMEDRLGSIAPGKLADLIVVDQNPYTVETDQIHRTRVVMTFIDGSRVFDARQ